MTDQAQNSQAKCCESRAPSAGCACSGARPSHQVQARGCCCGPSCGCGEECPYVPGLQVEDWPLPDPKGRPMEQVRAIRDEVRARVAALVASRGWGR